MKLNRIVDLQREMAERIAEAAPGAFVSHVQETRQGNRKIAGRQTHVYVPISIRLTKGLALRLSQIVEYFYDSASGYKLRQGMIQQYHNAGSRYFRVLVVSHSDK